MFWDSRPGRKTRAFKLYAASNPDTLKGRGGSLAMQYLLSLVVKNYTTLRDMIITYDIARENLSD
jgi:hypothetical protein